MSLSFARLNPEVPSNFITGCSPLGNASRAKTGEPTAPPSLGGLPVWWSAQAETMKFESVVTPMSARSHNLRLLVGTGGVASVAVQLMKVALVTPLSTNPLLKARALTAALLVRVKGPV